MSQPVTPISVARCVELREILAVNDDKILHELYYLSVLLDPVMFKKPFIATLAHAERHAI